MENIHIIKQLLLFDFILSYFVLTVILDAYFHNGREIINFGVVLRCRGSWSSSGGRNHNQNIFYENNLLTTKVKRNEQWKRQV